MTEPANYQRFHRYLTSHFPRADSPEDMRQYGLSEAPVARYHQDGFLARIDLIRPDQVECLGERLERLRANPDGDMDSVLQQLPEALRDKVSPVAAEAKAGQASIHHSHTIHGSRENRSGRPRRALVLNYMGAETRCADGTAPLLKGVPLIAEGAFIEGDHFPIVLDLDSPRNPPNLR